jgi:methyl-accepting chemotaxis protein
MIGTMMNKNITVLVDLQAIKADRLMGWTLVGMFALCLGIARYNGTWFEALAVGLPATIVPWLLIRALPGSFKTRISVALAFMVFSALVTQQAHGMIETHFLIFILLAFLLYYRDWRPIFVAALAIAVHHVAFNFLQAANTGIYLFTLGPNLEVLIIHALAVVFETGLLIIMAKGDWDMQILTKSGDHSSVKAALQVMVDNLSSFSSNMQFMSAEHDKGNIKVMVDTSKFQGSFEELAQRVNSMVSAHISESQMTMAVVKAFGEGNFDLPLKQFPGEKASINTTVEQVRSNIKSLIADMQHMSAEHQKGNISFMIDPDKYAGSYRFMAEGLNSMVAEYIDENKTVVECVAQFGDGNFSAVIKEYPGEKAFINKGIKKLVAILRV